MVETVEVQCRACGQTFYGSYPVASVVNSSEITMMIWIHQTGDTCAHCRTRHVPQLKGLNEQGFMWDWMPVGREGITPDDSQIIVPPGVVPM